MASSNVAASSAITPVSTTKKNGDSTPTRTLSAREPPPLPVLEIPEVHKLSLRSSDEEILKDVCLDNGINYSKLEVEGPETKVLEMFFSGFPRLTSLHHFPNLRTLTVIGQTIPVLTGLTCLTSLKELWVAECNLQKIEGLNKCLMLEKLYLYGNQIPCIENLDTLESLYCLWLSNNKIKNIENLAYLVRLKELNLAENKIEKIGHGLDSNIYLEELNLSGNPISSLRDLTNLVRLPKLRRLSMKDPLYSPCPLSQLCNYSTHVLFHLPSLERLDTYDVTAKHLAELAYSTVMKKKMYYNMMVKTVKRNMASLIQRLEQHKNNHLLALPHQRLRTIVFAMKEVEREVTGLSSIDQAAANDSDPECEQNVCEQKLGAGDSSAPLSTLQLKLDALKNRKYHWERKCSESEEFYEEAVARIHQVADMQISRLLIELETGGNVRFEEGSASDVWFTSCHDLVMSRFCATDFRAFGVMGLRIHRILRIHNRILRSRFDKKLVQVTDVAPGEYYPGTKNATHKKLMEYLFWIWDPEMPGGSMEPLRIPEEGFMDADTYNMLDRDGGVPLSNSLSLCDRHRIASCLKQRPSYLASDAYPFRFGQLIVAKTYLGKSSGYMDSKRITSNVYPKIDSVFKPRKKCTLEGDHASSCDCINRQCEWYIFDNELVLPEYIIEFEYITKDSSFSPYTLLSDDLKSNKVIDMPSYCGSFASEQNDIRDDEGVLHMQPTFQQRPRIVTLTEELILKEARSETLSTITHLNLHGCGLTRLRHLQSLTTLRNLVVSFNDIIRLDDIANMNIEFLDASFNKISTLEGFKSMAKLEHLDLSWNSLHNTREELAILRKHCTTLRNLSIHHNPWLKPEGQKLRVIGRIRSLKFLNGEIVSEQDSQMALRLAAGSRITQLSLLTNSRIDTSLPRSLSLGSGAHIICHSSRLKPVKISESDTMWFSSITAVNLENQCMTKISNLDKVENLRWASFSNNYITKIEGLDNCLKLEELVLENNCLSQIEGLSKLTQLRSLTLSHNQLSSLDGGTLGHLPLLTYLALDNNALTSLAGVQQAQGLVQLYLGNNRIANIREIFLLKQLTNLVTLDMFGNPVASQQDSYRLFVVYHLKMLKALDGCPVEAQEGNMAKDMFGGRLTPDFVAEKLGHATFEDVRELDLPSAGIRIVELGTGEQFINLRSVNLENNNLTSFSGLTSLVNMRVLCLNNNHVECIVTRSKGPNAKQRCPVLTGPNIKPSQDYYAENLQPLLQHLEVLHLGYNGIKDMGALQLGRLPSLKALFLQGNEIQKVEGLDGLHDLRELVLDRNKIKTIPDLAFANQWNLQELHLEENRIRELGPLCCMENLQRLYLGSNRIQDIAELEKLDVLVNLIELSVVNNAVARRLMHRVVLVYRMPHLLIIDGIPITDEEHNKAEMYFADQIQPVPPAVEGAGLPGIMQYQQYRTSMPVRVTNVQLSSNTNWGGAPVVPFYEEIVEPTSKGAGRRRPGQVRGEMPRSGSLPYQTINGGLGFTFGSVGGGGRGSSGNNTSNNSYPYMGQLSGPTVDYMEQIARLNQQRNNKR